MAKDILKDAIADAKAVREVALANAKAALEEAFTPRLQSMLSAKLSEELEEELEEDTLEETEGMEDEGKKAKDEVDEIMEPMDETKDEKDLDETYMEEVMDEDLDEEVNLEEILAELELEESEMAEGKKSEDDTMDETKKDNDLDEANGDDEEDEEEEKVDEMNRPNYKAEYTKDTYVNADEVMEGKEFDLDALLEEINNLDETEDKVNEWSFNSPGGKSAPDKTMSTALFKLLPGKENAVSSWEEFGTAAKELGAHPGIYADNSNWKKYFDPSAVGTRQEVAMHEVEKELEETKAALEVKSTELNEVNLLNSKLLYVNRIFKANNLSEGQKLRVVETLDNAETIKEAKLIYKTIKDTFTISKENRTNPKRSIRENFGMASKAAGTSTAPTKAVLKESNDMVARFKKLANIKINQ